jgi:two-component system phosphate regulon sensor histidine kinase PhoR
MGWLLGHPILGGLVGLALCHLQQSIRLWLLGRHLQHPKRYPAPSGPGLWHDIQRNLLRLERRQRRRKRQLRTLIEELRACSAALPDAIVAMDHAGHIQWFNDAAARLIGLKNRDMGTPLAHLVRHPDFTMHMLTDDWRDEVTFPAPQDEQVVLAATMLSYGHHGQRLMVARDATAMARVAQIRRDFVANASHELRTPLTVINGYLDTLLEEASQQDQHGPLQPWMVPLTQMAEQTTRMQQLINDLLQLSKMDRLALHEAGQETVDVATMVQDILGEISRTRPATIPRARITSHLDEKLALHGSPKEMHSIIMNLVENALEHTPPHGQITISWQRTASGACLRVIDTGCGIASHHLPRLTERFYRVDEGRDRARGGTGLGLAIVKHAVERHGGTLEIESTLGQGSSFACHFPATRLMAQAA